MRLQRLSGDIKRQHAEHRNSSTHWPDFTGGVWLQSVLTITLQIVDVMQFAENLYSNCVVTHLSGGDVQVLRPQCSPFTAWLTVVFICEDYFADQNV